MKTSFNVTLQLRIAQEISGKDKFTKEEIIKKLTSGEATIERGDSCCFITLRTNNHQIMAEVEEIISE